MSKQYEVNIDFRSGPSFGTTLWAPDEFKAQTAAKAWAGKNGFSGPVKRITARELDTPAIRHNDSLEIAA